MDHRSRRTLTGGLLLIAAITLILATNAWACNPDPPPCRATGQDDGSWWTDPATDTLRVCFGGTWIYHAPGTEEPPCRPGEVGNTWRDGRYGGGDYDCQDLGPNFGQRWVPLPDITPEVHTTDDACYATWTITVPQDPLRSTTVRFDFGDGYSTTRAVPQGSATTTLTVSHDFDRSSEGQTLAQRATVVETGKYDDSLTDHLVTPCRGGVCGGVSAMPRE